MSNLKGLRILVCGLGTTYDIEIMPGVTARDVLNALGLKGYLAKFGDRMPFGENDEVYTRVEDGQKLILFKQRR